MFSTLIFWLPIENIRFPSKSALGSVHGAPCTTPDSGLIKALEPKIKKVNQPVDMVVQVLVGIEIGFGLFKSSMTDESVTREHWVVEIVVLDNISKFWLVLSDPVTLIE